ncbi:hypothetical protein HYT25_03565 [Candidatus Pacearchaeota archaeon]|nr:hypothetical protein [Candidatus Pacearchaeota archaeon]
MVQNKELENKIKRMCYYLEFYDKYGFFPFEKKRIDITLSGNLIVKLKEKKNISEFIEESIKSKLKKEKST